MRRYIPGAACWWPKAPSPQRIGAAPPGAKAAVGVCWYILAGKDTPWRSRPWRAHGCHQAVPPSRPGSWWFSALLA